MTFWFRSVPCTWWISSSCNPIFYIAGKRAVIQLKYQVWKSHQLPSVLLVLPRKLDFFNLLVTDLFTWAKWSIYSCVWFVSQTYYNSRHNFGTYFLSQVCVSHILIPDTSKIVQLDPRETLQSQFALVVIPWGLCKWDWICSRQPRVINPSAVLANNQLVCLLSAGILKTCYVSFVIFVSVVWVARLWNSWSVVRQYRG